MAEVQVRSATLEVRSERRAPQGLDAPAGSVTSVTFAHTKEPSVLTDDQVRNLKHGDRLKETTGPHLMEVVVDTTHGYGCLLNLESCAIPTSLEDEVGMEENTVYLTCDMVKEYDINLVQ